MPTKALIRRRDAYPSTQTIPQSPTRTSLLAQFLEWGVLEHTLGPGLRIGEESWLLAFSMAMKSSTCMEGGRLVFCLRDRNMSFMRGLPLPRPMPLIPRPPPRIGTEGAVSIRDINRSFFDEMTTNTTTMLFYVAPMQRIRRSPYFLK